MAVSFDCSLKQHRSKFPNEQLKSKFLTKEKEIMQNQLKDLEESLLIHKALLNEFIKGNNKNDEIFAIYQKLAEYNEKLMLKNKDLLQQRDEATNKELIFNQLCEYYKEKEKEQIKDFTETIKEYQDKLNNKEYEMQVLEKKYNNAEYVIKKYVKGHERELELIETFQIKGSKIIPLSNVVEENISLKNKVEELTNKVEIFRNLIDKSVQINYEKDNLTLQAINKVITEQKLKIDELYNLNKLLSNDLDQAKIKIKDQQNFINNNTKHPNIYEENKERNTLKENIREQGFNNEIKINKSFNLSEISNDDQKDALNESNSLDLDIDDIKVISPDS